MQLLNELQQLNDEKEKELVCEGAKALNFLKVERAASMLRDGGIAVTPENIANFAFMPLKDVNDALTWITKGPKGIKLPFELNTTTPAKSVLDTVMAGLLWIERRTRAARGNRPLPPEDAKVVGVQRIMQLTGLGRVEILDTIENNREAIVKEFPDFRDSWVADTKEIQQKNAKNQHPETKLKLIRQAIMDISGGRIGSVTAEQLAKWQNGKIGYDKRQIDNLLSNSPELRDLDKYRAHGRTTMRPTDADKAAAYQRSLLNQGR